MNAPDRTERFILPENVKKVEVTKDTKVNNAATFTIQREDHTIGNLLRSQLLNDPDVYFVGYRIPHPLTYHMNLRVQTNNNSTPLSAVHAAVSDLKVEYNYIREGFEREVASQTRTEYH